MRRQQYRLNCKASRASLHTRTHTHTHTQHTSSDNHTVKIKDIIIYISPYKITYFSAISAFNKLTYVSYLLPTTCSNIIILDHEKTENSTVTPLQHFITTHLSTSETTNRDDHTRVSVSKSQN
jgi:hypothetical protein